MPATGLPTPPELQAEIRRAYLETGSLLETMKRTGCGMRSARRYGRDAEGPIPVAAAMPVPAYAPVSPRLPDPAPEAGGPTLPDPVELEYKPVQVDTPGTWLVINDLHLPFHDRKTIELAVAEARRRQAVGVLLNGDVLDCAEVSEHDRDPDSLDLVDEVEKGKQLIRWIRSQIPAARLIYKEGNHDGRIPRYVLKRAPALFKLAGVGLPHWLELANHGVEWVDGKRVVRLGRLNVIHGHEYKGGGGVSPARWLYLKARSVAMCGHFHRSSAHDSSNIEQKTDAAWSVGCACYLHPAWLPLNDWNQGFALVTLESDGWFSVENKKVISGRVV